MKYNKFRDGFEKLYIAGVDVWGLGHRRSSSSGVVGERYSPGGVKYLEFGAVFRRTSVGGVGGVSQ